MAEVPVEVFRHGLSTQIVKHVRPPTRRDLGRKLRKLKPVQTTRAVVDETLRVRGLAGLRVADASIMPTQISGNTNAPSIMIGEKASDLVLADVR